MINFDFWNNTDLLEECKDNKLGINKNCIRYERKNNKENQNG